MTDILRSRLRRPIGASVVAAGIGAVLFLGSTSTAWAGPAAGGDTVTAADQGAAQQALASPDTAERLATFFVNYEQHKAGQAGVAAPLLTQAQLAAQAPQLVGGTVPVYSLNPDFVRGKDASAPVASFAFLAAEARAASGATATVWTERDRATQQWQVTNILSGSDEVTYARQAGATDVVFTEPQIAAWYAIRGQRVVPLNPSARESVGADGVTIAAYRKLVHGRYGDKLAGSEYQRSGKLGGFSATGDTTDSDSGAATATRDNGGDSISATALTGGAAGGILLLGAGTWVVRRRRDVTPT